LNLACNYGRSAPEAKLALIAGNPGKPLVSHWEICESSATLFGKIRDLHHALSR
jgi:hypothetical protein